MNSHKQTIINNIVLLEENGIFLDNFKENIGYIFWKADLLFIYYDIQIFLCNRRIPINLEPYARKNKVLFVVSDSAFGRSLEIISFMDLFECMEHICHDDEIHFFLCSILLHKSNLMQTKEPILTP